MTETKPAVRPNLLAQVKAMESEFSRAVPSTLGIDGARYVRLALTQFRTTPQLLQCSEESVLGGLMQAAQLGLEISNVMGQCWLIPRKNKSGRMEATFQLGYKGLIDLAGRSGVAVDAQVVREGDSFVHRLGTSPVIDHEINLSQRGEAVAYYAVARAGGSVIGVEIMTRDEMEAHRAQYADASSSAWRTAFDAMARKTIIARLLRRLPLSAEVADALSADSRPVYVERATIDGPEPAVLEVGQWDDSEAPFEEVEQ